MGMSRQGSWLVVSRSTQTLPDWCVSCGEPGGRWLRQTYSWHPPILFLLVFLTPIVYALFAAPFLRKMTMKVALCKRHATRRLTLLLTGALLLLGSIPMGYALGLKHGLIPAILAFLAGLVIVVAAKNAIRPIKFTETDVTFAGAGEGFLRQVK